MILLPVPKYVKEGNAEFLIRKGCMIVIDERCTQSAFTYAKLLQEEIEMWAGINICIGRGTVRKGDIVLRIEEKLGEQHYTVTIKEDVILLEGGSLDSLGWAVQTLRQIIRQKGGMLNEIFIDDEPDILNRGFFFDVTRGRVLSLDSLKKLVDRMAFYKQNQFQLYIEHTYLFRDLTEVFRDDTPLTAEEILELDKYCYERGIELVPSLATFGHLCKLLRTKSYEKMCELPESNKDIFSFKDRMAHHTVNVSNLDVLPFIKSLIKEYMLLFRSDKFNICADETFDLGKGKSSNLAEEKGIDTLYMDYIMELFEFLIEHGKTPMFWGDVITHYPEKYAKIPKQVICLNWGYSATQEETEARTLYEVGATQYLCPGVCGWNTWVNLLKDSYENIKRMCSYARKYKAVGILNTEWGDYGHINQPIFSIPGMIYGAVCSWNDKFPDYEDLNYQISILEFGDHSGKLLELLGQVNEQAVFSWYNAVSIKEGIEKKIEKSELKSIFGEDMSKVPDCNQRVLELEREMFFISRSMDSLNRGIVECIELSLAAIWIWNEVGFYLYRADKGERLNHGEELAGKLERCLQFFKELWRKVGKEAELARVSEVFFWYADLLRNVDQK